MNFISISTELLVGFIALLILTKMLGKTQITQITPFDFISSLVLGELVGNAIYDKNINAFTILYTVFLWGILIYFIEWITQKFRGTRNILEGSPSIVIRDGKIDRNMLKKNKLDINQLQNMLRQKDIFSLCEVKYAIVETSGTISVLRKEEYLQPTRGDLNLPSLVNSLSITFISDGKVDWGNLNEAGFDEMWLENTLKTYDINSPEDVLILEWNKENGVFLQLFDNK